LGHLVQSLLGGPAEIDPRPLRLPHDPPHFLSGSRAIDGLPSLGREPGPGVHPNRRRPAPYQGLAGTATPLGQHPLDLERAHLRGGPQRTREGHPPHRNSGERRERRVLPSLIATISQKRVLIHVRAIGSRLIAHTPIVEPPERAQPPLSARLRA